jgi:hypothetical protein
VWREEEQELEQEQEPARASTRGLTTTLSGRIDKT